MKEQGRLLRQDKFTVWHGKKKHSRRVFMFEDLVIFSKAKSQPEGVDLFYYKNSLKVSLGFWFQVYNLYEKRCFQKKEKTRVYQ